ncbi:beta-galactosidase [Microbispora bryophytorum]|uniref:beta-galactosidase n=1 Tax=Microbispora bryophytorum TaxID=1460882 RepID=UPI00115AE931|nr:beta-galactosidase [Microbispora bryophytorum]MBD3138704.1 beta-galactosidase [Microbispora bryophytorum]TQS03726.1 beta-galactosidase [Microbispora bryophytorum]
MRMPLWYGGDYNPEQWPEEVWAEDVALMRRAGVTLVTVGVFSWSRLEPAEGRYTFGWLDRVLDLLAGGGIGVDLAVPTASPPPWFSLAHPDALTVTRDGVRLTHGSRDTYCVSAPAYREASMRITRALAERYRDHRAPVMWHVHNEYGTPCHCDHAAAAFRAWLRRRYGGLDALNDAWTTAFWGQHYSDWAQITPPRATQYLPNPGQALDFRRFVSDEMLAHFTEQRDLLRELTPGVPVTTNYVLAGWACVDHWKWSREVDLVSVDDYPSGRGMAAAEQTAFTADLARSWAGGRPWLLMEQATGYVLGPRAAPKEPGEIARHSLQHVARGSQGAMFFQWRASRGGAEQWHPGMVPHAGPDSRVFREVCALGEALGRIPAPAGGSLDGPPVAEAEVAILWDEEAWWAVQGPGLPSAEIDYLAAAQQAHRVLWRQGVAVCFAHPSHDLPAYRAVLVPSLYLISDAAARNLAAYVEGGGTLVVSFFSGIADEHTRIRLGGYPGALREILGVRVEEFRPLAEPVELPELGPATVWSEVVHLEGAEAVARYPGGRPAVTRHRFGAGTAWYVSTRLDDSGYARVLAHAGPAGSGTPGVEVVRQRDRVFAINHTEDEQPVPVDGIDLITGRPVDGSLGPGGYVVVPAGAPESSVMYP